VEGFYDWPRGRDIRISNVQEIDFDSPADSLVGQGLEFPDREAWIVRPLSEMFMDDGSFFDRYDSLIMDKTTGRVNRAPILRFHDPAC